MHWQTGLLALLAVANPLVHAHSALNEFFVNGAGRGAGTCIRMNTNTDTDNNTDTNVDPNIDPNLITDPSTVTNTHNSTKVNMYIVPVDSDDMACGIAGQSVVNRTCPIHAGDTVAFQWRARPGESADLRPIYDNHLGPCSIYMKLISTSDPAPDGSFPNAPAPAGNGWFKIMYDVKDDKGVWCTERMRLSKDGAIKVQVPADVQQGYYLLRPEIISLTHARQGNPQVWASCVQVYITGGTGTARPPTIAIPGHLKPDDVAMNYNVLTNPAPPFPEIGGPVYTAQQTTVDKPGPGPETKLINKVPGALSSRALVRARYIPEVRSTSQSSRRVRALVVGSDGLGENLKPSMRIARSSTSFLSYLQRRQTPSDPFGCPANTIMELGNACLPAYPTWTDTDEKAMPNCKAAQNTCFATADNCYKITNPAVNNKEGHGCRVYRLKCDEIKKACVNKVMSGPTNPDKILTPPTVKLTGTAIGR